MLNSPSQRHHSAGAERGTATPKESMTLDVQVNISKAAKFTIACQLAVRSSSPLLFIPNAPNRALNGGDLSAGALVYMAVYFPSV